MQSVRKPWWQQATAIVSLGAGGAVTGLSFVPGTTAEVKSPSNMLIRLLAQEKPAQPAAAPDDATLRSTIVNVANYYLRMAAGKTPAEMEAIIWQHDSVDGADHGESCAAFASLTLELAAQAVGQQSWVTGGSSYPWPLEEWADVRVDPNPASLGITSVLQDAQAHHRWHPLGDGYEPLPGDWVLFHGHVEVVTQFSGGVLHTVGGDSLPNFTVNAHEFSDPLGAQGVVGFVNNGALPGPASKPPPHPGHASAGHQAGGSQAAGSQATTVQADQGQSAIPGAPTAVSARPARARSSAEAAIPGMPGPAASASSSSSPAASSASPDKPSARRQPTPPAAPLGESAIPGLPTTAPSPSTAPATAAAAPSTKAPSTAPHPGSQPPSPVAAAPELGTEQAFISEIAAGAIAAQHRYGVPASVTIAQAIDESAWGQSGLATRDHNLFGIKGSGPAGSDPQPTHEYENGQSVTRTALFRVYHDAAESIDDHGKLLATSGYYRRAMADRQDPNAFADALTGVYATDPGYGTKLIGLMQQYDLYRYDNAALTATARAPRAGAPVAAPRARKSGATSRAARPGRAGPAAAGPGGAAIPGVPPASPVAAAGPPPPTPTPAPTRAPKPTRAAKPTRAPGPTPAPTRAATPTRTPGPTRTAAPTPTRPPAPRRQTDAYQASAYQASPAGMTAAETMFARSAPTRSSRQAPRPAGRPARAARTTRTTRAARTAAGLYQPHVPPAVWSAFNTTAKARLLGEEPLYRDVASVSGIRWELLAACDWMQCEARSRYSPVHGEKLCTVNRDGTVYRTKSEALEQCAEDLAELTWEVYRIDLTAGGNLSIRDLASAFAAFRWGGLLKLHHTSAMEFPYSVAGLTDQHVGMRWPNIAEPNTPDKPGSRFRMRFGAVPIVLGLSYPATV
jgi:flagellum-specific peptidoglycan hydrolase FlgJ